MLLAGCKFHDSSIWWVLRPKKKAMGFGKLLTAFADQAGGWDFFGKRTKVFNEILHRHWQYDFWTNSITWFTHLHIICFLFPLCCRTLGQSFQEQFNLLLNTAPKRRSWRFFVHLGEMKPGSLDGHRHQAGLELREYYAAACGHCQVRWGMLRGSWGENLPFIWHIWLYHTIHTACSV